ncbi:MAG TPA: glycosyltransferase family 39 protein [Solirubrobacterales bacterium]|nr:glycosyltransferase family 39 protein [Solirubrobacterales bacterium]
MIALLARLAVIAADTGYVPQQDAWDYDRHARSIAEGDGFPPSYYAADGGPSALRAPGYPYFLGFVYSFTDKSVTAGRIANALLGALAVWLIYLMVRRLWGARPALVAAAIAAVFPPLVLLSRDLLSESLFIALELGTVLCVIEYRRRRDLRWAAAAGLLGGLAALTRNPGPALAIPVLVGLWVFRPRLSRRALTAPALALAVMVLAVLPWTIRNAVEFDTFVPITSGTGFAMAGTYNELSYRDEAHPASWRTPRIVPEDAGLFRKRGIDEATLDAELRHNATSFASDHPGYVLKVTGWDLVRMFEIAGGSVVGLHGEEVNIRGVGSADLTSERIGLAIVGLLALIGIGAMIATRGSPAAVRVRPGPVFFWLVPIFLLLVSAPINGLPRQRIPIDPFLITLAALGAVWAWDRLVVRSGADRLAPV